MPPEIVTYSIEHVHQVALIEAELNPLPWSEQLFRDELDVPANSRHWLVAVDGDEVVGYAGAMFVSDEAHLMNVGVKPSRHREGIAMSLMLQMMSDVRVRGVVAMTLEVRPDNEAAIGLYRKFGYAPEGTRENYYPDAQDALIMWSHGLDSREYGERLESMAIPC
jgi:ribosomal-protein-alanine N-acetyltransferase